MCLLLLAMVPAWAADLPQEVTDAAPPAAEELEGKEGKEEFLVEYVTVGMEDV